MTRRNVLLCALVLAVAAGMLVPQNALAQYPDRSRTVGSPRDSSYRDGFDEGYRIGYAKGDQDRQSGTAHGPGDIDKWHKADSILRSQGGQNSLYVEGFREGLRSGYGDGLSGSVNSAQGGQLPPVLGPPTRSGYPSGGRNRPVLTRGGGGPVSIPQNFPPVGNGPVYQPGGYGQPFPTGQPPVMQRGGRRNGSTYGYPGYPGGGRVGFSESMVIEMETPISSKHSREGDRFSARVVDPPQFSGARVEGYIGRIDRAGRFSGKAEIVLVFQGIVFPDGFAEPMQAQVEDVLDNRGGYYGGGYGGYGGYGGSKRRDNDVNAQAGDEGQIEGKSSHGRDVAIIGASTAAGAVLGKVLGAGTVTGAVIGAAAGGGIVALNRGRDIEMDPGTQLRIRTGQGVRI